MVSCRFLCLLPPRNKIWWICFWTKWLNSSLNLLNCSGNARESTIKRKRLTLHPRKKHHRVATSVSLPSLLYKSLPQHPAPQRRGRHAWQTNKCPIRSQKRPPPATTTGHSPTAHSLSHSSSLFSLSFQYLWKMHIKFILPFIFF